MFLSLWIFIQIVVESLPISSSGHVMLAQKIVNRYGYDQLPFLWEVDFLLHGPTIIIVMSYFFKAWWRMVFQEKENEKKEIIVGSCNQVRGNKWRERVLELGAKRALLVRPILFIGIVDVITVLFWWVDFAYYSFVENYFLPIGFLITAFFLYATCYASEKKDASWLTRDAVVLGLVQGCCFLPGISRFASTYGAGRLLCSYNGPTSFALSFLIQLPLICAGFLKGLFALHKRPNIFMKVFAFQSLFVMLIASLVSYWLLCIIGRLIEENKLYYLAWYMILPILMSLFFYKGF